MTWWRITEGMLPDGSSILVEVNDGKVVRAFCLGEGDCVPISLNQVHQAGELFISLAGGWAAIIEGIGEKGATYTETTISPEQIEGLLRPAKEQ